MYVRMRQEIYIFCNIHSTVLQCERLIKLTFEPIQTMYVGCIGCVAMLGQAMAVINGSMSTQPAS